MVSDGEKVLSEIILSRRTDDVSRHTQQRRATRLQTGSYRRYRMTVVLARLFDPSKRRARESRRASTGFLFRVISDSSVLIIPIPLPAMRSAARLVVRVFPHDRSCQILIKSIRSTRVVLVFSSLSLLTLLWSDLRSSFFVTLCIARARNYF